MRLTSTLTVAMVFSVCIAGCAARRCSKCCCPQQTQRISAQPEVAIEPKAVATTPPSVLVTFNDDYLIDEKEPVPSAILVKATKKQPEAKQIKTPTTMLEPILEVAVAEPRQPTEVRSKTSSSDIKFGHADDYSWLTGQLHKVHVPGVEWKLRYLPIDQVDQWGGGMVLAPDIRLEDFNDLDMVYVKGKKLADRPSLYVSGPLYRIESIQAKAPNDQHSKDQ